MRRRTPAANAAPEGVPAALYDYQDAAWATDAAARKWCRANGVPGEYVHVVSKVRMHRASQYRRHDALTGWAEVNAYMSKKWPKLPDWRALGELGLVASGSPTGPRIREDRHVS